MKALKALRDSTARSIQENPVEITIHRIEFVDDGAGGRMSQESVLSAFTGRLVPFRQSRQNNSQNEAGQLQAAGWILIAPWDATLKHGSDIEDTFAVDGRTYRVVRVIQRMWQGEIYAVHAVVEEVS